MEQFTDHFSDVTYTLDNSLTWITINRSERYNSLTPAPSMN